MKILNIQNLEDLPNIGDDIGVELRNVEIGVPYDHKDQTHSQVKSFPSMCVRCQFMCH